MRSLVVPGGALLLAIVLSGCAPPDVAGVYDVNLAVTSEDCPDIDEGDTLDQVTLDVTQNDRSVSMVATIVYFGFIPMDINFLGETKRRGFTADSTDDLVVDLDGAGPGTCEMSYSLNVDADVDNDGVINGTVTQVGVSNGSPDCTVNMCTAVWDMLGTRNP
ncbi:MAG TPA: hypothetical protein VG389_11085 [Myxococcota bacterium]|nr:hypothetical protein [Myxococcota bacterium]